MGSGESGGGSQDLLGDWGSVNVNGMYSDFNNIAQGRQVHPGADAAQSAAEAQRDAATNTQRMAMGIADTMGADSQRLSQATPQELSAYGDSLNAAKSNLDQQQKLLSAVDPSLMEASKQILNIMQGGQTSVGGQYESGRNSQRQQLVNNLRSQYGPGAETSSVGRQALNQFDMQTTQGGIGVQNQALGTLSGVMGMGQSLQQGVQSGIGTLSGAGNNFSMLQQRQLGANQATAQSRLAALTGTSQPVINSAGAGYTSQFIQSQDAQKANAQTMGMFANVFGSYVGGGAARAGQSGTSGGGGTTNNYYGQQQGNGFS